MQIIRYPEKEKWSEILKRPVFDNSHLFDIVQNVLDDVRQNGDEAIRKYTEQFDKVNLETFEVTKEEIAEGEKLVSMQLKHPAVLYAAKIAGIHRIFKIGGTQAIAAMAYGTETVPKVYKIFGPGNQYVTAAKQLVSLREVAIDMPAGPSEVEVLADKSANPVFVAADLLSQAEHGVDSQSILVTVDESIVAAVVEQIEIQLEQLPRKELARKALENSKIIILKTLEEAVELTNEYAPEHLIICTQFYMGVAANIVNAGSVFLGNYTPESAGDYASGTNHTLPTNGWARSHSGVNLDSFIRKITFQEISKEGLKNIGPAIEIMAAAEELEAHKNAVSLRLKEI